MAPERQVSLRQLQILVEFAEANRAVVLGVMGKGPLGQRKSNKAWEMVARRLNSIGGGMVKTAVNWKRYWHVLKCRTKAKAADVRRSRVGNDTDGEANKITPLTDLEKRIVAVLGNKAVSGVNPTEESQSNLSYSILSTAPAGPSTAPASSTEMGVEFVDMSDDEELLETLKVEPGSPFSEEPSEPASDADEPPSSNAPGHRKSHGSQRYSRPRHNPDENLLGWAYDLEERRTAVEERLVEEIAGLGAANRAIVGCLQQIVQLLRGHLNNNNSAQ